MVVKHSILVVEDDPDLAEMLSVYFRVQGYEVLKAGWGDDAVRISREKLPDLIMLDIRLPDIDGYEVCRRVRSNHLTAQIPIIFLTERRDRVDKLQGLKLGAIDYITKPFDLEQVRLRVRNSLRRTGQGYILHPITGLPDGRLVAEQLKSLTNNPRRGILLVKLHGTISFRETYGIVAADDALRRVSLQIFNTVRDGGHEDDFVGHISSEEFVILLSPERLAEVRRRLQAGLDKSLPTFYPLADRASKSDDHLSVSITSPGEARAQYKDVQALQGAFAGATVPAAA